MTPPLTIVLPLHNTERVINRTVQDILEVVQAAMGTFAIVLVDNGSNDDTHEAACQLSRCYPQITVLRLPVQSGLGAVIELIRNRVTAHRILIHDGVSPIGATQLGFMLNRASGPERRSEPSSTDKEHGSHRFTPVSELMRNMQRAHQAVALPDSHASGISQDTAGFQWVPKAGPLPTGHRPRPGRSLLSAAHPHSALPDPIARST